MAAPTFQDYFNAGRAEAINRRPDLTFDEGDISEFLVAGMAAMADHLTGYFAGRFKATYLDGAEGDDLTTLADDHWNVQRFPALAATGTVTFSRTTGNGAPAGTLLAGTVVATQKDSLGNEIQFTTDHDVNWGLADVANKTMTVTATVAGLASNCDINKVNRLISTPFDSTIAVNNPTSKMAGGDDEETDADLRERVRGLPATLRRGTLGAVEYGALSVAGVKKATAVEEFDTLGRQTGIVDLYVSDSQGNSTPTMITAVQTEELNWRPAGGVLNVFGGLLSTQNVAVTVVARLGTDTQALLANIIAAVTARVNKLRIGETLSPDIIKQAVLNVDDSLLSVTVTAPAVAVVPPAGTLIRCGTVTVS
jgi:uncharacterized phage protein gp47/JayE